MEVVYMYADPNRNTRAGKNGLKYVTAHNTANTNKGADALAHGKLQAGGNVRVASWHETTDDKRVVVSHRPEVKCFHAGDGLYGPGNNNSYAIEIAENSDGDLAKAIDNGARRCAYWLNRLGLPISRLKQHFDWSGKDCPRRIRGGMGWAAFKRRVEHYMKNPDTNYTEKVDNTKPSPAKPKPQPSKIDVDGLWGMDTTGLMQKVLGTPQDRLVSSQSDYWRAKNPGLTTGWQWVTPARSVGSQVILAHQKVLQKRGHYRGKLDAKAGVEYFKAIQRDMGTVADGEIWKNSPAIKALQRRLNEGKI